jgi:hypothetical protein
MGMSKPTDAKPIGTTCLGWREGAEIDLELQVRWGERIEYRDGGGGTYICFPGGTKTVTGFTKSK